MGLPPVFVAVAFLIAVIAALVVMAYVAWKGSQPSSFFSEAVKLQYDMDLPESDIQFYEELKEKLHSQYAPEASEDVAEQEASYSSSSSGSRQRWVLSLPQEDRCNLQKALMRRLIANIDRLDKVQRDKPGNWKLWREKLVSERYWISLCEAEKFVGEEINTCVAEADELEPGWRDHIFREAVQHWRMQKQRDHEKKEIKKAKEDVKKQKEKEERAKEVAAKKEIEDKERQERLAEKMMEKLLREEEMESKATKKGSTKEKAKPKARTGPASGSKKK